MNAPSRGNGVHFLTPGLELLHRRVTLQPLKERDPDYRNLDNSDYELHARDATYAAAHLWKEQHGRDISRVTDITAAWPILYALAQAPGFVVAPVDAQADYSPEKDELQYHAGNVQILSSVSVNWKIKQRSGKEPNAAPYVSEWYGTAGSGNSEQKAIERMNTPEVMNHLDKRKIPLSPEVSIVLKGNVHTSDSKEFAGVISGALTEYAKRNKQERQISQHGGESYMRAYADFTYRSSTWRAVRSGPIFFWKGVLRAYEHD